MTQRSGLENQPVAIPGFERGFPINTNASHSGACNGRDDDCGEFNRAPAVVDNFAPTLGNIEEFNIFEVFFYLLGCDF